MKHRSKTGNFQTKKATKIFVIILLALVALFFGVTIIISQNIRKIADYFIENEFDKSEAGRVYNLTYEKINLRLFSGSVMIRGLALTPKASFFSGNDTLRLQNPVVFKVQIPELTINGLNRNFSLLLDEIDLNKFVISQPEITLIEHLTAQQKKQVKHLKSNDEQAEAKPGLKKIAVDYFGIDKGKFIYFDHNKNVAMATIGSVDFDAEKLTIDLSSDPVATLIHAFANSNIRINDGYYPLENGLYDLRLGSFLHQGGNDEITLKNFRLIPKYDKVAFSKKLTHQTERMDLTIQSITISKPNLEQLAKSNSIELEAIDISGIKLNAYRDKNVPLDMTRFPKLPQQALAALTNSLNIPIITIADAYIVYEELPVGEMAPGKATIRIDKAELSNVTNRPSLIAKNGPMAWTIDGQLFDAADLSLKVKFPPDLTGANFQFTGTIGECDMDAFNMITENAANLRINSGTLQKIKFDVAATEDYATGELTMQYNDLSIVPLKKDKEKRNDELNLLGGIANAVIRNSNPHSRRETDPKQAEVFFVRDKNKSIFNYMAKSLISGVKSTILPVASETREKYDRKQERETKQNERMQRRGERKEKRNEKHDKSGND